MVEVGAVSHAVASVMILTGLVLTLGQVVRQSPKQVILCLVWPVHLVQFVVQHWSRCRTGVRWILGGVVVHFAWRGLMMAL